MDAYYYTFARERIHIDGDCQNRQGQLAARSVLTTILRGGSKRSGLVLSVSMLADGQQVVVHYHVPVAPLQLDTINVSKAPHYGFSVVTPDGRDILQAVNVVADSVVLNCTEKTDGCRVRYALNGEKKRSGRRIEMARQSARCTERPIEGGRPFNCLPHAQLELPV